MAEGDGATIDVHPRDVRVVLFCPCEHDRGEGLVDLDEVHVKKAHTGALQYLCRSGYRSGQHGHRVDTDDGEFDKARPRPQPEFLRPFLAHDKDSRGPVGDLRRVASGELAVRFEGRLKPGEGLDSRLGADALVGTQSLAGLLAIGVLYSDGNQLTLEA